MRRQFISYAALLVIIFASAFVRPAAPAAAANYTMPSMVRVVATVPAASFLPRTDTMCLARSEESGGPQIQQTLVCYTTVASSSPPPPPPPPYQQPAYSVWLADFDPVTGLVAAPVIQCTEFLPGFLAVRVDLAAQMDKAGGPATGTMTVTEDITAPFDCANGLQTTGPATITPLAQSHDEDIWGPSPNDKGPDGCSDWEELGDGEAMGGLRDPFNFWDFFDTPNTSNVRDGVVSVGDMTGVVNRYGATGDPSIDPLSAPPPALAYHPAFDRGQPIGPDLWNLDAADGAISVGDITAAVAQFGHSCVAAP